MLEKWLPSTFAGLAIILFLLPLAACRTTGGSAGVSWGQGERQDERQEGRVEGGPPAHAPAHGYRAKHRYRYYPDSRVYYEPARGAYFYLDNGVWQVSVSLPGSLRIGTSYVWLELETEEPYRYNHEHQRDYPPGQIKKKKKKYKNN